MGDSISFIHLSDIHFTRYSGDKFDIDEDLRNEIIRDISKNAKTCLKNIKGILVCGDIAFSGQESEYKKAQNFLNEICRILPISETSVYCVPGNHDVDQSIAYSGSILHSLQEVIEKQNTSDKIDSKLSGYMRDRNSNGIMFQHIETYNTKFASKFGCNISVEKPNWQVDFPLDNANILRLYGLNSTNISNIDDHRYEDNDKPMVIGKYQVPKRQDGVIYMSLCHHPPECWKDPNNNTQKSINSRIKIQLYGHKHVQEIKSSDECLIIGSGATHPSRFESDWKPRYNWISLKTISKEGREYLSIDIYERVLNDDGTQFIADIEEDSKEEFENYLIKLGNEINQHNKLKIYTGHKPKDIKIEEEYINVKQIDQDTKIIAYRFMELPFVIQTSILIKYKLINEDDQGKKYIDIIDKIIEKSNRLGCLDELAREILSNKK